jgi:hypothetical protein
MLRPAWLVLGVLGLVLAFGSWVFVIGADPAKEQEPPAKRPPDASKRLLIKQLNQPIAKPIGIDPNFPFRLALDLLADKLGVRVHIDYRAFKSPALQFAGSIDDAMIEKGLKFQAGEISVAALLQMMLDRLPAEVPAATVWIRPEGIVVTTKLRVGTEIWRRPDYSEVGNVAPVAEEEESFALRPLLPLVQASFEKRPLAEALDDLAEMTCFTIALDERRVEDKARRPVTALLLNTPLDSAVRLLADQTELKVVLIDNTLYVTTPGNAAILHAEGKAASWPDGFQPE